MNALSLQQEQQELPPLLLLKRARCNHCKANRKLRLAATVHMHKGVQVAIADTSHLLVAAHSPLLQLWPCRAVEIATLALLLFVVILLWLVMAFARGKAAVEGVVLVARHGTVKAAAFYRLSPPKQTQALH